MSFHNATSAYLYDFAEPEVEETWLHADRLRGGDTTEEIMPITSTLPISRMATIAALAVVAWMPFVIVFVAGR
jgi:hypothetical protein